MSHFLCKLSPPRPTFLADMSADEALVMRRHREYWTPRVEIGVVIAMGPVADPAGAYGVAIVEAPSQAASPTLRLITPTSNGAIPFDQIIPASSWLASINAAARRLGPMP